MEINERIEHTMLKATTSKEAVAELCATAIKHQFVGVCVPPYFVKYAKELLKGKKISVVTVIGFPLGYQVTPAKVEETKRAIDDGAKEVDMVMNIAAFKSGDLNYFINDIKSVTTCAHLKNIPVKVIIETAYLNKEEIVKVCKLCDEIEVDYVKTSTGFAPEGATVEAVKTIRENISKSRKIKASGGIKTKEQAEALIKAGADRLGTSSSIQLMQ